MREYDPPDSGSYLVCCPYCGSVFSASLTKTFEEVTCPECVKKEEWHRGAFLTMLATMTSISHEPLPYHRDGTYLRWRFRVVTKEGIKFVEFLTDSILRMRPSASDIVTFSYSKRSTGIFKKHWNGAWKSEPTAIADNENKKGWLTIKAGRQDGHLYHTFEGKRLV